MPKATSKGGGDFSPLSAGVHHAVCYQVIDIGTQPPMGNFVAHRKVMIAWEIPAERLEYSKDGKQVNLPRVISKDYTLSTDKKANLRKDLESWRGRPFTEDEIAEFETAKLIGANCQICVVHKPSRDGSKIYANVSAIMPISKTTPKVAPENPTLVFDLPESGPINFPEGMYEWVQNKIKNSEEYIERSNGVASRHDPSDEEIQNKTTDLDEDVPF
jgi:hypothetical protein